MRAVAPLGVSLACFVAAAALAMIGVTARRPLLVGVGKPAATVFLVAILGGVPHSTFGLLVLNTVVLSLAADIALLAEGSQAFVVGLALSLVGYLCLALAFLGLGPAVWALPGAAVFGLASTWFGRSLWPHVSPALRGPYVANLIALVCMLGAVFSALRGPTSLDLAVIAALGAALLYFSQVLLAWMRFRAPLSRGQAIVFGCYWAGQLCLVLAARWGVGGPLGL